MQRKRNCSLVTTMMTEGECRFGCVLEKSYEQARMFVVGEEESEGSVKPDHPENTKEKKMTAFIWLHLHSCHFLPYLI